MHSPVAENISNSFIEIQQKFSRYMRQPVDGSIFMGLENRRMNIYRDLIYNNIEGFLSSGFPVIREIYSFENWHKMVRDFIIMHHCQTPYYHKIVEEFIDYLAHERVPQPEDPMGLLELAHYEWVELALSIADDEIDYSKIDLQGDLLLQHPVLSPLACPLSYQFPVHKIGADYLPDVLPEIPTYIVVYRNDDDDVKFMEVSHTVSHMLAQFRDKSELTGYEVLMEMANEINTPDIELFIKSGLESLQQLHARKIIIGTI